MNLTKPALLWQVGGVLTFDVPETDAVTSPTLNVFDYSGNPIAALQNQTPSVSEQTLSFTVPGSAVPTLGRNYRCEWRYTVDGVAIGPRNTTFEVVRSVLYKTLTPAKLTGYYARLLNARYPPSVTSFQNEIDRAWAILQARIRGNGKDPNHVIDPRPLEPAHALYAAALIAANYQPGNAQGADWQKWAADKRDEADREFDTAFANLEWFDVSEDLIPSYDEENAPGMQLRVSR